MTTEPKPPRRVRLYVNDNVYPLDETLRYIGLRDGVHEWRVYGPHDVILTGPPTLRIGVIPPHTKIALPVAEFTDGTYRFITDDDC